MRYRRRFQGFIIKQVCKGAWLPGVVELSPLALACNNQFLSYLLLEFGIEYLSWAVVFGYRQEPWSGCEVVCDEDIWLEFVYLSLLKPWTSNSWVERGRGDSCVPICYHCIHCYTFCNECVGTEFSYRVVLYPTLICGVNSHSYLVKR